MCFRVLIRGAARSVARPQQLRINYQRGFATTAHRRARQAAEAHVVPSAGRLRQHDGDPTAPKTPASAAERGSGPPPEEARAIYVHPGGRKKQGRGGRRGRRGGEGTGRARRLNRQGGTEPTGTASRRNRREGTPAWRLRGGPFRPDFREDFREDPISCRVLRCF